MKFCSKCGKHYKDSDTFCKDCGIKLTQGAADSSGLADLKESASQALSEASSKAKEAFSEENRQKLQEKASAAAGSVGRFQALSANAKKIIAAVFVVIIAFGCYEYVSPEKQVERALNNSIQVLTEVSSNRRMNIQTAISRSSHRFIPRRNETPLPGPCRRRVTMSSSILERKPIPISCADSVPTCSQTSRSNRSPSRATGQT